MRTKPLLCLVSDRRRLAESAGRPHSEARQLLLRQVRGALDGGIDLLQIRERDLEAGDLALLVSEVVEIARGSSAHVIVNDRADVAIAAGAAGVHLRETSISSDDLRRLSAALMAGRSVHSVASLRQAGSSVDYVIAGTVFPTESKGGSVEPMGCAGLEEIVRAAGPTPVLAIGGISAGRIAAVCRAGAAGVAAIGAFIPGIGRDDIEMAVRERVESLRSAFATAGSASQRR